MNLFVVTRVTLCFDRVVHSALHVATSLLCLLAFSMIIALICAQSVNRKRIIGFLRN